MFDDLAIASISTIAASGETEPFKYLLNHPSIGRAVVLGHYDGDEVNKIPVSGCGGLHGKNQQLKTSRTLFPEIEADDLDEFISQIEHTDVFLQTHLIAQKVAQLRKDPLPIIAAAQIKYPLQEAIKHLQEGDFSDTKTLIIETPNIVISQQIAGYLASLKLVKEWIEKKGGPIIIGEVKSGHTTDNIYTHKALTY